MQPSLRLRSSFSRPWSTSERMRICLQVKETLAAIQERAKVLGLQADAMHLTRLAGIYARPLSVKRVTMYSAAWVKSQVQCIQSVVTLCFLAQLGVVIGRSGTRTQQVLVPWQQSMLRASDSCTGCSAVADVIHIQSGDLQSGP